MSASKRPIWPRAGIESEVDVATLPSGLVASILTLTGASAGLEMATPVCVERASRAVKFPDNSAGMRNAFAGSWALIAVSLEVILFALALNTPAAKGVLVFPDGATSIQPVDDAVAVAAVLNRRELFAATEYVNWLPACPSRVTVRFWPDGERNLNVPVSTASLLFTSNTSVLHPPPSAIWGIDVAAVEDADRSATGNADIMNSPRSLRRVRTAAAEIGTLDENVNVRASAIGLAENVGLRKGASFRNAAIWEFAGIVMLESAKFVPVESAK
jgi:hypothetical protein